MSQCHKRYLIFCEGLTEYIYAKALQDQLSRDKARSISVEYNRDLDNTPATMVKKALRMMKEARQDKVSYDRVFLIFDHDNRHELEKVFRVMNEKKIDFIFSSISIEFWFLLHYEDNGRSFISVAELITYLKRRWPEYHKTKMKHYQLLKDNLTVARARALRIRRNYEPELPLHLANPWTNMDQLIDFFDELDR